MDTPSVNIQVASPARKPAAQDITVALTRRNRRRVDDALAHHVQACFLDKVSLALPKHAILAVQKLLDLRRQLPRA